MLRHITIFTIILMYFFSGVHLVFSAGTPLERIQKLEEENQELREKYIEFNKSTEQYIKILSEGREISDEKEGAYDRALNEFDIWLKVIFYFLFFLAVVIGFFGWKDWDDIRNKFITKVSEIIKPDIKESLQVELREKNDEIDEKLNEIIKIVDELEENKITRKVKREIKEVKKKVEDRDKIESDKLDVTND